MATEQFRHECEVRAVAALPSNDRRREYLSVVEAKRGKAAALRLRRDVWDLMRGKSC